jgi:hypothetical protein
MAHSNQMIRRCAGIDVGLSSGAAAVYGFDGRSNRPALLAVTRIPTTGEGAGKRIDVWAFQRWLMQQDIDCAYIENATAMPAIPDKFGKRRGMGAGTMARYMRAVGAIESCVTLSGIDSVLVMPGVWKKAVGLRKATKNESVILAREVFPEHAATTFKFLNSHNIAESALLSLYAAARCDLVSLRIAA